MWYYDILIWCSQQKWYKLAFKYSNSRNFFTTLKASIIELICLMRLDGPFITLPRCGYPFPGDNWLHPLLAIYLRPVCGLLLISNTVHLLAGHYGWRSSVLQHMSVRYQPMSVRHFAVWHSTVAIVFPPMYMEYMFNVVPEPSFLITIPPSIQLFAQASFAAAILLCLNYVSRQSCVNNRIFIIVLADVGGCKGDITKKK